MLSSSRLRVVVQQESGPPSEGRLEVTPGDLALANASVYQRNAAAAVREENGGEVLPSEEPAEAHSCRRTSE